MTTPAHNVGHLDEQAPDSVFWLIIWPNFISTFLTRIKKALHTVCIKCQVRGAHELWIQAGNPIQMHQLKGLFCKGGKHRLHCNLHCLHSWFEYCMHPWSMYQKAGRMGRSAPTCLMRLKNGSSSLVVGLTEQGVSCKHERDKQGKLIAERTCSRWKCSSLCSSSRASMAALSRCSMLSSSSCLTLSASLSSLLRFTFSISACSQSDDRLQAMSCPKRSNLSRCEAMVPEPCSSLQGAATCIVQEVCRPHGCLAAHRITPGPTRKASQSTAMLGV